MNKTYIALSIVVALIIGVVVGYTFTSPGVKVQGISSPGVTNSSRRIYSIAVAPLTATTTAVLNTDGSDRAVTEGFAFCTTVAAQPAVNTWQLQAATSSTAANSVSGLSNFAVNLSIATTSTTVYTASTTFGNDIYRVWPANTYLVFGFNATNTASCTIGVSYLSI